MEAIGGLIVWLLAGYAAIGFAFAIAFVAVGVQRIDAQAKTAGAAFRLIIFPGVVAMWPLLLHKWIEGVREPKAED